LNVQSELQYLNLSIGIKETTDTSCQDIQFLGWI